MVALPILGTPDRATGPIDITLDAQDEEFGSHIGKARDKTARARRWRPRLGPGTDWAHDIGARAEVAVCRVYGLDPAAEVRVSDWSNRKDPDVGGVDVRGTVFSVGCLKLYESDASYRAHGLVLVMGGGLYRFAGWTFGWFAKTAAYFDPVSTPPFFRFPQTDLFDPAWFPIRKGKP